MSAPSRKQLVNFVAVTAFGPSAGVFERMTVEALLEMPSVREVWLKRHRELQAALSSEDATRPKGQFDSADKMTQEANSPRTAGTAGGATQEVATPMPYQPNEVTT